MENFRSFLKLSVIVAFSALLFVCPSNATAGVVNTAGPDAFGYTATTAATESFGNISGSGEVIELRYADGDCAIRPIEFDFQF